MVIEQVQSARFLLFMQIFQLKKRRGIKVSDIDTAEKSDDDEQPAGNDPS
jgi:hypothetical protein